MKYENRNLLLSIHVEYAIYKPLNPLKKPAHLLISFLMSVYCFCVPLHLCLKQIIFFDNFSSWRWLLGRFPARFHIPGCFSANPPLL